MKNCVFCEKLPRLQSEKSPFLAHEFKNSILLVGDHQTYPGYCLLVLKSHVSELFELKTEIQIEFYNELITSAEVIKKSFSAEKINVSNYGNMTPHQHWHIFPRKKTDSNWPNPPWTLMSEFDKNKTTDEQARKVSDLLKSFL